MERSGSERGAPEGPSRFECPEDFAVTLFAPGPPFSPETLQSPSKQLLLIKAPINFSPESLEGRVVPFLGFQTLKVLQPDGTQKVYGIQTTRGDWNSSARLLVPSGHQSHLIGAPLFSGCVSFCERYGDPGASQPPFPVVTRPAPQIPEGLKQRFLPFGGQPKRPPPFLQEATDEPPRKKKKKRKLGVVDPEGWPLLLKQEPWVGEGPEVRAEEPMEEVTRHKQKKGAVGEREGLCRLSAIRHLHEQDAQPHSSLGASSQESLLPGEAEEWKHWSKKRKKEKRKEEVVAQGELLSPPPEPHSLDQLPELESHGGENSSSGAAGLVQRKHKKKRKHDVEAWVDPGSIKAEVGQELSGPLSSPEGSLALPKEEPTVSLPSCKSKKKRKKRGEGEVVLPQPISMKQELGGWGELESSSGQHGGGGGLRGPLEAGVEWPGQKHHKKKRKKHKRGAAGQELDFIKEELSNSQA
ncbi:DNA-directed RNA polymerase I subunit RPA34 [Rhineura floridana]|uniref:DNA-directed RNA polymerase I subunit RPA34 n=1 Tax=Rhineura floridana TaxID=261503 RepID=UPI002AC85253|nr:DNA-directed RNA polymerase I subunit RPA34 [Rhineura floridana]